MACPAESLTALKPSRSRNSTAGGVVPTVRFRSAWATRSVNNARLGRPVNASWKARRSSCACKVGGPGRRGPRCRRRRRRRSGRGRARRGPPGARAGGGGRVARRRLRRAGGRATRGSRRLRGRGRAPAVTVAPPRGRRAPGRPGVEQSHDHRAKDDRAHRPARHRHPPPREPLPAAAPRAVTAAGPGTRHGAVAARPRRGPGALAVAAREVHPRLGLGLTVLPGHRRGF